MRGYRSRDEETRDLQRERAAAERLATTPPFPASGAMWESIRASHPDIPEASLALLLSLVIDFWWGKEVECVKEDATTRVYVRLGEKHRTQCLAEMSRVHPAHYVIIVDDHYYLVVDKDRAERGGELFRERELVEVGIHPEAQLGEWYYKQNLRESSGYRSILQLPVHDLRWRSPPRPDDIIGNEAIRAYREDGREAELTYEARVAEVERQELEMRARTVLGQAWKLQFLLRLWCGINLSEDLWTKTMDQVLAIQTSRSGDRLQQALSWAEAIEKFSNRFTSFGDDSTIGKLQMVIMLQLADRQRRGDSSPLLDPLNPKGQDFVAALNQYKDLPGLRTSLDELRTLDKPSRRAPHHEPDRDPDY